MPPQRYDHSPDWNYDWQIPSVMLQVGETAVAPPYLTRAVGLDGREQGWLRRFPGFKKIDTGLAALTNVVKFWYVSIQKGTSQYELRGFVFYTQAGGAAPIIYFDAYDTENSSWTRYTLDDFTSTEYVVRDFWRGWTVTSPWNTHRGMQVLIWDSKRKVLRASCVQEAGVSGSGQGGSAGGRWNTIDPEYGYITGLPASDRQTAGVSDRWWRGGCYYPTNDAIYVIDAGFSNAGAINKYPAGDLSESAKSVLGLPSALDTLWDLTYDPDADKIYGVAPANPSSNLYEVTVNGSATASLIGSIALKNVYRIAYHTGLDRLFCVYEDGSSNWALASCAVDGTDVQAESPALSSLDQSGTPHRSAYNLTEIGFEFQPAGQFFYLTSYAANSDAASPDDTEPSQARTFSHVYSRPHASSGISDADVTSTGRYIYITYDVPGYKRTLARAYWYDLDGGAMESRMMGASKPAHPVRRGATYEASTTGVFESETRTSLAIEHVSRLHGVRSPLSLPFTLFLGTTTASADRAWLHISRLNDTDYGPQHAYDQPVEDPDAIIRIYRSIVVGGTGSPQEPGYPSDLTVLGNLYLEQIDAPNPDGESLNEHVVTGGTEGTDGFPTNDEELQARAIYDFVRDAVGPVPRCNRIAVGEDQVFLNSVPLAGEDPLVSTELGARLAQAQLVWSPPERRELENFRGVVTGERYRFPLAGATMHQFEPVGEYMFAVYDQGIIRLMRSGSYVSVNPLRLKWGALRYRGATSYNNSLAVVTPRGLMLVDSSSLAVTGVGVVRRLLTTTDYWRASLASVVVEHDALIGALILLNTDTEEMYLLWTETGALSSLEDVPFSLSTSGPDPESLGPVRSFWSTSTGVVYTPDADEDADRKTMYGAATADTVNGTATGGTITTLEDTGASFSADCVGFYVHFLSGDNAGEKRKITSRTSTELTWATGFTDPIASGDRYAVAPIPFKVRGWQLPSGTRFDKFRRKIITAMNASVLIDGGETDSDNVKMTYNAYKRLASAPTGTVEVAMNEDPTKMAAALDAAGPLIFPEWTCFASDLDFRFLAGQCYGKLTLSERDSPPA